MKLSSISFVLFIFINIIFVSFSYANIYQVSCKSYDDKTNSKIDFFYSLSRNELVVTKINNLETKYKIKINKIVDTKRNLFVAENKSYQLIHKDNSLLLKKMDKNPDVLLANIIKGRLAYKCSESNLVKKEKKSKLNNNVFDKNFNELFEKNKTNSKIKPDDIKKYSSGTIFYDSLYFNCNLINEKDPTAFKKMKFVERDKTISFWDRRLKGQHGKFKVFVFSAEYENRNKVSVRVNSEFKTIKAANEHALKYANMLGRLPYFLRKSVETLTIHDGATLWGGGNKDVLIHIKMIQGVCEEEVMMHEAAHTSLDYVGHGGKAINEKDWVKAMLSDRIFISEYAKNHPFREDIAETNGWWVATRCKKDRIKEKNFYKVNYWIPNRLKYLDSLNLNTYPLKC